MALKGLIRSYNNTTGAGSLFDFENEGTYSFSDGGGSGFSAGDRVTFSMAHPGNDTDPATISNVTAE